MSKVRAKKIKLILFDVDGVLTDGTIWLVPAPGGTPAAMKQDSAAASDGYSIPSNSIVEAKGFHAHDGVGISLARIAGIKTAIITRRNSETVALRARDLKIDHVLQGQIDKNAALDQILKAEGLTVEEAAFLGDDIVDLPAMRRCGLAIAVPNAREEVKDESHFITDHDGGQGAARDAVEYILRAQGRLEEIVSAYLENRIPTRR
jgi:3-deoxy-D-manno-octulosonate 8-phosphate phosphatase (KDO 8-P phosphatase)